MNTYYYVVESIDGDYANLRRTDEESHESSQKERGDGGRDCGQRRLYGL